MTSGAGMAGLMLFSAVFGSRSPVFSGENALDQIAAEHVGSAARFPSITAGTRTDMYRTRTGVRIQPVNNPSRLFNALFAQSPQAVRNAERTNDPSEQRFGCFARFRQSCMVTSTHRPRQIGSVFEFGARGGASPQMSKEWLIVQSPNRIKPIEDENPHIEEMPLFFDLPSCFAD